MIIMTGGGDFLGPIVDAGALVMHSARHQRTCTQSMQLTHTPAQFQRMCAVCGFLFHSHGA